MKSSSRLFPVRLESAESRGDLLEDVYLIKPNNSPDKSVELAITRLGARDIEHSNQAPLILFHGCYQNHQMWLGDSYDGLAPMLARNGLDVWLLDARGHGLSIVNDSFENNTLADYARYDIPAAAAFVAEVCERPPMWLGHNEGFGALLMSLACGALSETSLSAALGLGEPFPLGSLRRLPLANHLADMVSFGDVRNETLGPELESKALRHQLWREQGVFGRRGRSLDVDLWSALERLQLPMAIQRPNAASKGDSGLLKLIEQGKLHSLAGGLEAAELLQRLMSADEVAAIWAPLEHWFGQLELAFGLLPTDQIAPAC
ncbi:alpha/beta fold hydrolase [uncultured Pseudoteredinibacter sp.]|uniref:alpha/beta hydrolase n=1 Tax=uncultured Pseudoteredinibacter sp. TaxID=1641701 RepID=UPI00260A40F9|nr:alpha/beta fold hydrolase [uncultured Pseudoteredinibacter sp.]